MNGSEKPAYRAASVLVILCTGFLVYNMVAIPVYKEQVFLERGTVSAGAETIILIAFALVAIFNLVSLLWVLVSIWRSQRAGKGEIAILALGALCLILLFGEKTMVDEISHEYQLGWKVTGEWIILYVGLAIQLLYNLLILRRVYRGRNTPALGI